MNDRAVNERGRAGRLVALGLGVLLAAAASFAVADVFRNTKPVLAAGPSGALPRATLTARDFSAGGLPRSVAVGDFNGDGFPDLAVANYNPGTVSVLLGKRDGTFGAAHSYTAGTEPLSVALGEFNGDGKLDLVVVNGPNDPRGKGTVSVLLAKKKT